MLNYDLLKSAAHEFLTAALVGNGLQAALSRLAVSAGARDATLLVRRGVEARAIIRTSEIAEPAADFMAGRSPPSPRQARAIHPMRDGFFTDYDDYSEKELKISPVYQDFLRPLGYSWHANAKLAGDATESIELSFKRWSKLDPYTADDLAVLNAVWPVLHSAVRVARTILNATAEGMVSLLQRRGSLVFELDSRGHVLRTHGSIARADAPLLVSKKRLVSRDRLSQCNIDAAIAAAVTEPRRPSVALLREAGGTPLYLRIFPVPGCARDIFLASAAVAVLIRPTAPSPTSSIEPVILREAFGLTNREAELASLMHQGLSLDAASRIMGVQISTARVRLKSIFGKTSTRRQGELISLLARLQP